MKQQLKEREEAEAAAASSSENKWDSPRDRGSCKAAKNTSGAKWFVTNRGDGDSIHPEAAPEQCDIDRHCTLHSDQKPEQHMLLVLKTERLNGTVLPTQHFVVIHLA